MKVSLVNEFSCYIEKYSLSPQVQRRCYLQNREEVDAFIEKYRMDSKELLAEVWCDISFFKYDDEVVPKHGKWKKFVEFLVGLQWEIESKIGSYYCSKYRDTVYVGKYGQYKNISPEEFDHDILKRLYNDYCFRYYRGGLV